MKSTLKSQLFAALGLVLALPAAHATVIIGAEQYNPGVGTTGPPSTINCVSNDLLQTSLSSATGELTAEWRSGLYADAVTYRDSPFVTTYALDVASNPSGYDIKEIRVFSGWDVFRSGQAYDIMYSLVWSPDTFLTLGTVLTPSGLNGAMMTRTYDSSAGASPDAGSPIPLLSGGANGDTDADGIPNLVEYALTLDPTAADGPPGSFDGSLLSFSKRGVAVTNNDVTCAIQTSTTLVADSWEEVGAYVENSSTTISCTLPAALGGRVFARLIVTQTP